MWNGIQRNPTRMNTRNPFFWYHTPAMLTRYQHILWDWNGTLFDDAGLCMEIINGMLGRRQMPAMDHSTYQTAFTFPVKNFYQAVGFDFARESFEIIAAEFMAEYDRRRFECRLQSGAREALETLMARGFRQSILSAYEQSRLEEMVAFMDLHEFFHHLVGLNDYYSAGKLESGKRFIGELGILPESVVLIGDTLHDAEVAEAMGIACILVPCGHYSRTRLLTGGVPVVDALANLLQPD